MAPLFLCPVGSPPVATAPSLALSAALDVLVVLETLEELDNLEDLEELEILELRGAGQTASVAGSSSIVR